MNEETIRFIIEGMTWSYSRITTFEDCPYKWFMKYILGEEKEDKFYALYGSFMHELLEKRLSGDINNSDMLHEFLLNYSKKIPCVAPSEKISSSYVESAISYIQNFQFPEYEIIALEDNIPFSINEIPFVAKIDYLGRCDGGLIIIDHKSRNLKQRSKRKKPTQNDMELDKMFRQLYIYSEAVKQRYGEYPCRLCFNCFKNKNMIYEDFDYQKLNNTLEWATKKVHEIEKTTDFHPIIEYFPCRFICDMSKNCCYYNEQKGDSAI